MRRNTSRCPSSPKADQRQPWRNRAVKDSGQRTTDNGTETELTTGMGGGEEGK